ncbi:MAG: hypothetical protein M3Q07_22495 [Pseudobdellovibrionaceae bacterium]|nr:hypothetical protein [Pseudobdellovibrionaceae bacterium]
MKKIGLIILLFVSLSWITSLAEDLLCDESDHEVTTWISPDTSGSEEDSHPCHTNSCHFGHCAHLDAQLQAASMDEPGSSHDKNSTPYAFTLRTEPITRRMRPPLDV